MKYKLLAFDMDSTLLTSDKKISPASIAKLEELHRRGVHVVVSTGRGISEISDYRKYFQSVTYGIMVSGAVIFDFIHDKPISLHPIEENLLIETINVGIAENAMVHLLTLKDSIANENDVHHMADFHMEIYQKMFEKIFTPCNDFKNFVSENPKNIFKVNIYHRSIESRNRTIDRLKNLNLQLTYAERTNLEATPKNISKGSGLVELCKFLNIGVDECVAIGDGYNDEEILKTAGVGVAMGNASEEIKKIADFVTDDNDHEGVLKAIEKFFDE
ncbi:MAG: HAD family phosphatase [Selenomonadaceae bacterium]|nr:HAD family phosphatase [Selenomonadaceae bacterium]